MSKGKYVVEYSTEDEARNYAKSSGCYALIGVILIIAFFVLT